MEIVEDVAGFPVATLATQPPPILSGKSAAAGLIAAAANMEMTNLKMGSHDYLYHQIDHYTGETVSYN